MTQIQNIIIICSDQHRRDVMGCSGNDLIDTPNLDALAAAGTRFTRAYCNAPICVPSRASLATGLQIHEVPSWDNADPYHGQRRSFMHRLQDAGLKTASIGKLHYRNTEDDTGFDEQIIPMHVVNGTGTFYSLLRDEVPRIKAGSATLAEAGPGETDYTAYDAAIADETEQWLANHTETQPDTAFFLNVSFVNPHPPYVAPQGLFDKYMARDLPAPTGEDWSTHPSLDGIRQYFDTETPLDAETHKRVIAGYYANVEYLDQHIGRVLRAIDKHGLRDNTMILYITDHGDTMGEAGLYGKCSMFEGSVAIPMILAGPGVEQDATCDTAVQLLDVYPTVLDAVNAAPTEADQKRTGTSLYKTAAATSADRWVLIQDHCAGSTSATFGLTNGKIKYVHHLDFSPMLFDLESDPKERRNLADDPAYAPMIAELVDRLHDMVDPTAIDAACRASQHRRAEAQGGFDQIMARVRKTAHTPPPSEGGK